MARSWGGPLRWWSRSENRGPDDYPNHNAPVIRSDVRASMPVLEAHDVRARQLVQQLTEDLGWLEERARARPEQAQQGGRLRLAAALVRNCLGPYLENAPPTPLHVVVVGGAGVGKSTITNFLTGAVAAEANPQAGFTRHPIAYTSANGPLPWSHHLAFLGPLQRLFEPQPSSLDRDVYQVRRVSSDAPGTDLLSEFVVWDCPDMTTWHATGYLLRLIEVTALADLVIYVASDERYNDEPPTQFLQMALQAGKPVIACLMKMRESQAQAILDHFRRDVVARLPECPRVVACLAVPHLSTDELADPAQRAARFRQPLLDQVAWWAKKPSETRRAAVRGAADYLEQFQDTLLAAAQGDLIALQGWRELVETGRTEFENRYRREYLSGEKFPRFNEALVRLLQLLELPGIGQYVSKTLWLVRTPYRLVKGLWGKFTGKTVTAGVPEEPVLTAAFNGWLNMLRKEAARRGEAHPLWVHVEKGFQGGLVEQARHELQKCLRDFQVGLGDEVEVTARAIYEDLEQNPIALNTLRTGKFAMEVAAIGGTLVAGTIGLHDLILVPLMASLTQELVELLGKQYVDVQRERARQRQQELFSRSLAAPLAAWLAQWPATGGSNFESLQLALRRIPEALDELTRAVYHRLDEQTP